MEDNSSSILIMGFAIVFATIGIILLIKGLSQPSDEGTKFNIFQHERFGIDAVKIGFCWPAFFFGFSWMLFSKLWTQAILYLAGLIVITLLSIFSNPNSADGITVINFIQLFIALAITLAPGISGNEWRENNYIKRGFKFIETIEENSKEEAIEKFFRSIP